MNKTDFGEKLQTLRKEMDLTQNEFAELVKVPQPSISAYENNRNSPTVEVLISIADKCNVSLDWLCGLSNIKHGLSSLGDISDFLYAMVEAKEIELDIEIQNKLPNDIETEKDKWYSRITVFGNDPNHEYNSSLCRLIENVNNNYEDLTSYGISKDVYDLAKEKSNKYYDYPLTKKDFPELSREERIRRHVEYLNCTVK